MSDLDLTIEQFCTIRDQCAVEHYMIRLPKLREWEERLRVAIGRLNYELTIETRRHYREELESQKIDLYWKLQAVYCERVTMEADLPLRLERLEGEQS